MSDRFNIEEEIMDCWHVVDELRMLSKDNTISREQMAIILRGLSELYALKFDKLFRTFEESFELAANITHAPKPQQQADLFANDVGDRPNLFDDNMNRGGNGTWTI